jgi:tetratricopeptide (TPR) repeat protein
MASDLVPGQFLGHFCLVEQIGAGGMGVVFRAHDDRLQRDVAVKVLPPGAFVDDAARKRFKQEALALAKLNHPNIATVFDFDCDHGRDFLVMELLTGETVSDLLKDGPFPRQKLLKFAAGMAEGLAAAHEQGIVHRDLKPGNLGLSAEGRVKLLDFGLAKLLDSGPLDATQSITGVGVAGTLPYMSPEQLMGEKIDARSDIYAAGAVLYQMATGKRPHPEHGVALIDAILHKNPPLPSALNPRVDPALEAVIVKAMDKDPNLRYQSARELLVDLERLTVASVTVASQEIARRRRKKLRPSAWVGILSVVLAGLAVGLWLKLGRGPRVGSAQKAADRAVILVGEFENRTGEPVFDSTLREMFSAALQQSPRLAVFPPSRTADILQTMGRSPAEKITEAVGREIVQRGGLQGVLLGSISRIGTRYLLNARAENAGGDTILDVADSVASVDDVPALVDRVAEQLRQKIGESKASVQKNSIPLAQVTSPSLEALRYYTLGKQTFYGGDLREAEELLKKALEKDPSFAMAQDYLGLVYEQLHDFDNEIQHLHEASLFVGKISEPEKLKILGDYYDTIMDFEKGCGNYQVLADTQPADPSPLINLGVCYQQTFKFADSVAATRRALVMVPKTRVRINLASQLFLKGDTEQALQLAEPLSKEYPGDVHAQSTLGAIYEGVNRTEDARKVFENMVSTGGNAETQGHLLLADLDLGVGHASDATDELNKTVVAAQKSGDGSSVAAAKIRLAEILARSSPTKAKRVLAETTLSQWSPALTLLLGRASLWANDFEPANRALHSLDRLIQENDVPALEGVRSLLQAEIALREKKYARAVDAAQKAVAYQNSPLAVETLARCYEGAGKTEEAAQQYALVLSRKNERIGDIRVESLDVPGFHRVVEDYYRLGVLDQNLGRNADATSQLQKFISYAPSPDPSLEIFRDAQRRLRRLTAMPESKGTPTAAK